MTKSCLLRLSILSISLIYSITAWGGNKDIELLRSRFISKALTPTVNSERITELLSTCNTDGSWSDINYVDTSRIAFQHTKHLANLVELSRAYKKKDSPHRGNKQVKQVFDRSLSYWIKNDFLCENWWNNQIGTPSSLLSVLLIMDSDLSKKQIEGILPIVGRAHLFATGARPGGDRIKIAGIYAQTALFNRDKKTVEDVIAVMEEEIQINIDPNSNTRQIPNPAPGMFAGGRGIETDYSFHHRPDRVNNTLSYGLGYAHAFIEWAAILADTRYRFSEEKIKMLTDYYLDGICVQMVYGITDDTGTLNRDICRTKSNTPAGTASLKELLKATNYRKDEIENIIKLRNGDGGNIRSFAKYFWMAEHFCFQRPSFYTSVRMYSTRVANMEEPYNGEGLLNHYRGDGANYLSVRGDEYTNLTPVTDWRKIPGATIVQVDTMPRPGEIQQFMTRDFVGAVTDGMYGAVSFDFLSPHNKLSAKKAWFFFDEAYLCLGAGITSSDQHPVSTTIEQNFLRGEVAIGTAQKEQTAQKGKHELNTSNWIHHGQVGYVFPSQQTVRLQNDAVSGSWARANKKTTVSGEEVREDVFKLWIDHGMRPRGASYEYIVLPAVSKERTCEYALQSPIKILSNTNKLQAVYHKEKDILYAIFHTSGQLALDDDLHLSIDSPGMVMIRREAGQVKEVTVADPTRKLAKIHVSINAPIKMQSELCSVRQEAEISHLAIVLPQQVYAGKSVVLTNTIK